MWIPGFGKYTPQPGNRVGDEVADFTLKNQDGLAVSLHDELAKKPAVLVFYPRASSPICTRQMCSLRDGWRDLMAKAGVFGISYDPVADLKKFAQADKLPITLLSDPHKVAARALGVNGLFAAARVTFVIGTDKRIKAVITKIDASDHAQQILALL